MVLTQQAEKARMTEKVKQMQGDVDLTLCEEGQDGNPERP